MSLDIDVIGRLIAAAFSGIVLGAPSIRQPGGIRAHALVAMGAVLFCKTGQLIATSSDEMVRVIQGVATGVGFIGGAAVIKHAGAIRGVNASASIWIAAAIGCLVALIDAWLAATLVLTAAALNYALAFIERRALDREAQLPEDLLHTS